VQPGHIFPLRAVKGGVLMRAGHTEAGCDLTEMAGLTPASVICEIIKEDGTMARLPDLIEFAREHKLKIGTIADLIHYRSQNESLVERVAERTLNTAPRRIQADRLPRQAERLGPPGDGAWRAGARPGSPGARAPAGLDPRRAGTPRHDPFLDHGLGAGGDQEERIGRVVLLNCGETAEQLFAQFSSLDAPGARRPAARRRWTCAPTASAPRS
jgi:3,4-dihydroxy 2-butanone 4-phosphate synthase/GTP cyclohydrolase II